MVFGDVLHRRDWHIKRRQADFDSRVVKQSQKQHAKKTFGVNLAFDFSGFGLESQKAPAYAVASC